MRKIEAKALAEFLTIRPRGFALFDIREAGEAEAGHIPDATSLPRRLIEFRIGELISARRTPLVVYDALDGRAELAAATLAGLGYADVAILEGGLAAWLEAGFPVTTGVNVPSKRFGEHVLEKDSVPSISVDALEALRLSGVPFVQWDVRTPAEHLRATIPGSRSMPGLEILRDAEAMARDGATVVVHCAGRTRSIIATRTLTLLGVRAVALENGTMGWRLSGRSLEAGSASIEGGAARADRAFALAREAGIARRDPLAVKAALDRRGSRNLVVIDVRTVREHRAGRIAGSVSHPGGQLLQCTDEVLAVEKASVILVDEDDGRAAIASYWLGRMGYSDVAFLEGGIPAWRKAGFPLADGPAKADPERVAALRGTVPSASPETLAGSQVPLLDVGTSRAWRAGHVPGALWSPRGWLEARIGDLLPVGARVIVTEAEEGQAILGASALRGLGYDAAWLEGGNPGWAAQCGPLATGAMLPLRLPPDVVDPPYAKGEAGMRRYLEWEIALAGRS